MKKPTWKRVNSRSSGQTLSSWFGQPAAGLGGTADAVAHARPLEKPLIWINPVTGSFVEERFERLSPRKVSMAFDNALENHQENVFQELDEAATHQAPQARHLIQRIILIHLFASAVGLSLQDSLTCEARWDIPSCWLNSPYSWPPFILTSTHRRRHEKWMQTRIEAEICRSFLATWQLPLRAGHASKITIQGFEGLGKSLQLMQCLDGNLPPPLAEARNNYLDQRIRNQINYFKEQSIKAHRVHRRLKALALGCTATAALLTAGGLMLSRVINVAGPVVAVLELLSLILPLVSAALFSIILTQEYSRRAARDGEMVSFSNTRRNN